MSRPAASRPAARVFAVLLGVAGVWTVWSGIADLLQQRSGVLAGAASVIVYGGAVAAVFGGSALATLMTAELVRPGERALMWWWGATLILAGAMLLGPLIFALVTEPVMEGRGYRHCPERVTGYTLRATRWVRDPRLCRPD